MKPGVPYALLVAAAIAITSVMDAHGLTVLAPFRCSRLRLRSGPFLDFHASALGVSLGRSKNYVLAVAYPLAVLSIAAFVAFAFGATHPSLAANTVSQKGFFRGFVAFALWHISYVTLAAGYILPPGQVVIFIVNAAVMGPVWGCCACCPARSSLRP